MMISGHSQQTASKGFPFLSESNHREPSNSLLGEGWSGENTTFHTLFEIYFLILKKNLTHQFFCLISLFTFVPNNLLCCSTKVEQLVLVSPDHILI